MRLVVSDQVAVIKIGAVSFVPQPDPELAPGWRAVVTFTRGPTTAVLLLDRRGQPINQHTSGPPVDSVPVTTVNPRHLPTAVCSLGSSDLPGLGSEWEVVANATHSRGRRVDPGVLFSCARACYAFPREHAVYSAAISPQRAEPRATSAGPTRPHTEHPARRLRRGHRNRRPNHRPPNRQRLAPRPRPQPTTTRRASTQHQNRRNGDPPVDR